MIGTTGTEDPEIAYFRHVATAMRAQPWWDDARPYDDPDGDRCSIVCRVPPRGLGFQTGTDPLTERQIAEIRYQRLNITCRRWYATSGEFVAR